MKLEEQFVSLSLAKKMKELGAPQEGLFYWYQGVGGWWYLGDTANAKMMNDAVDFGRITAPQFVSCVAYTVAELGEMLPPHTPTAKRAAKDGWICNGHFTGHPANAHQEVADTEANARASMWIYLKENNLI